ncbi:MAG: divalent metal cation transporter [Bacteroidetes bacterium]|nr:divalent metal cation transporter [Bacteroidota bacterium]
MKRNFLKVLGPGILFASTAIGVSHLVQSTRAGATYGFMLLWAVILANVMKYPFFEYGSRYANARGESIIDGYKRIGDWMLWLYLLITIGSMFFVSAAVGFVTAGFMDNLFGISDLVAWKMFTPTLLFAVCIAILTIGNYKALDGLIKVIASVLLISTIVAFIIALAKGPATHMEGFQPPVIWDSVGIAFIIALMGWMPTALDMSTWNSLWTIERIKQTGYRPTMKETTLDFNIGYWTAAALAICFVTLGALLMYGTGIQMPSAGHLFAGKVISLYTQTIGQWSYFIIGAAGFSIMFGTSIAVFDGYARALERSVELILVPRNEKVFDTETMEFDEAGFKARVIPHAYQYALLIVAVGSFIIISFFIKNLKQLVDLATTISFLISPIIAVVNFRLVSRKYLQQDQIPPKWMRILSYIGIIFLTGFSIFYVVYKISSL